MEFFSIGLLSQQKFYKKLGKKRETGQLKTRLRSIYSRGQILLELSYQSGMVSITAKICQLIVIDYTKLAQ